MRTLWLMCEWRCQIRDIHHSILSLTKTIANCFVMRIICTWHQQNKVLHYRVNQQVSPYKTKPTIQSSYRFITFQTCWVTLLADASSSQTKYYRKQICVISLILKRLYLFVCLSFASSVGRIINWRLIVA